MTGHTKGMWPVGFQVMPVDQMGGWLEIVPPPPPWPTDVGNYPGEFPRAAQGEGSKAEP